jgi:glycosyltransferase involved in cell wall biosynthesis
MERVCTVTIDVVIPAHNEEIYLAKTLEALSTVKQISNVIVVDDGSIDSSTKIIEEISNAKIKLIKHNKKITLYNHYGYWLDIGNHNDYIRAQHDVEYVYNKKNGI